MKNRSKKLQIILLLISLALVGLTILRQSKKEQSQPTPQSNPTPTYALKLLSGSELETGKASQLSFQITDDQGVVIKDMEIVHGSNMHAVVVRKDRTNFQSLNPKFDKASGTFLVDGLNLSANGPYRLFAEFTPVNAETGTDGQKTPIAIYKDIAVGDVAAYQPQPIGNERFNDSANGLAINVFLAPHDPSDPGLAAGSSSSFAVSVNKSGEPYRQLELYQDSRGSMVLFGPNLEIIHTHPTNDDIPDTYVLAFSVNFPVAGNYKAYLQTKDDGTVNTTDYVLSVE